PGKAKAVEINKAAIDAGMAYVAENIVKSDPYTLVRRDLVSGKFLVEGNEAAALGTVFGGVGLLAWYPITPSSSLPEAVIAHLADLRHDPDTGDACYAVVQAEDEIAAAGMVLGAGWAGARSMTATSGPGISLMAEFVGLGYYAEIPSVFWDVQRVGPSTGLPTRTQQADLGFVHTLGHGDTRHILLLPGTVEECFEFGWRALDYADRFQTPIFVLSDLDLGMNLWMSSRFPYPDAPLDRGKVLTAEELDAVAEFGRYADPDGDGIPYRVLPGTDHPRAGFLTRGSGHDEQAVYTESGEAYERNMARLARKIQRAATILPAPVLSTLAGAEVGILSFGSTLESIREARDRLAADGLPTDHMRLRALPLAPQVEEFVSAHALVVVVEANRDAQLLGLLKSELPVGLSPRLRSAAWSDGMQMAAADVVEKVREAVGG
ncbi:2-oxoacid:acceptor oxidoreductase subunit alpha, partial [bacterium]|nr:2-oxoacid:acceptor oxidoreductase subunit alpha [bacterium]